MLVAQSLTVEQNDLQHLGDIFAFDDVEFDSSIEPISNGCSYSSNS